MADATERTLSPPRIPVGDLARLFGFVGELANPEQAVFAETTRDQASISLADCFRLLRRLAFVAGEETLALSARPMVRGTAELVLSRAASATTLGEALREIAAAYNVLHGADYNRIEHRMGQVIFALHDDDFPYTRPRDDYLHFSLECTLIFLHAAVCELAQADLSARIVRICTRRTSRIGPGAPGLEFWRAPVVYGARFYALAYDAGIQDLPVLGLRGNLAPDLMAHNRLLGLIEQTQPMGPLQRTAGAVRRALMSGATDQDAVAHGLGLSVATLRRRLADEGASFRTLRQVVMNEYARERVLETKDIGAVAAELGFSDPRAFTRAFKTWNGLTPSDYRARRQQADLSENVP